MIAFLNGRFLPEAQAVVPITDRGFLYGDGLFETIRVRQGQPLWWDRHLARLERGAEYLKITLPWPAEELRKFAIKLIDQNALPESMLRLALTRGSGPRGYSPTGASNPTIAITNHPLSSLREAVRLATASIRVTAGDPLGLFKTANKLVQVLARAEAEAHGADEALLLNTQGYVAEAAASNLFWLSGGTVCTPSVADGALAGVTRGVILELCRARGISAVERKLTHSDLLHADGVFITNSGHGIIPVSELDGDRLNVSPFIDDLKDWLEEFMLTQLPQA